MERPGGLQSGFILHLVFLRLCRRLYAEHQNIFLGILTSRRRRTNEQRHKRWRKSWGQVIGGNRGCCCCVRTQRTSSAKQPLMAVTQECVVNDKRPAYFIACGKPPPPTDKPMLITAMIYRTSYANASSRLRYSVTAKLHADM